MLALQNSAQAFKQLELGDTNVQTGSVQPNTPQTLGSQVCGNCERNFSVRPKFLSHLAPNLTSQMAIDWKALAWKHSRHFNSWLLHEICKRSLGRSRKAGGKDCMNLCPLEEVTGIHQCAKGSRRCLLCRPGHAQGPVGQLDTSKDTT